MNEKIGIYKIENLINGKVYIGQSTNIPLRWKNHKSKGRKNNPTLPLYKAIQKYGLENFNFTIIENCSQLELNDKEIYWIKKYDCIVPKGYNITAGGHTGHSNKMTPKLFDDIISYLKNTSYSTEEIGNFVGVSGRTVRAINTGESWHNENFVYPIRKPVWNTPGSKIKDKTKAYTEKNIEKTTKYNILTCPICEKEFTATNNRRKYCSQKCSHLAQSKNGYIPTKEELLSLLIEHKNFCKVARIFNVTDNAMRKWCKKYNLSSHAKDYL